MSKIVSLSYMSFANTNSLLNVSCNEANNTERLKRKRNICGQTYDQTNRVLRIKNGTSGEKNVHIRTCISFFK